MLERPRPPEQLTSMSGLTAPDQFLPAPDLLKWIRASYLTEGGWLYTEEHKHLERASIGCLWTSAENSRHMRRIVAQAEMPANANKGGKWQKARNLQQLRQWFGDEPDFLLTFDAVHAEQSDDATFAALVDHELYHCAQERDEFGMPKFNKTTGRPAYAIRGHDVEEFVGVVRRFGIEAAGERATQFVIAAAQRPEIAPARVAQACGTCLLKAVA